MPSNLVRVSRVSMEGHAIWRPTASPAPVHSTLGDAHVLNVRILTSD